MEGSSNCINWLLTLPIFFAAVAAVASAATVYLSITVWNEQKEFNRPYFTIEKPCFKELPDGSLYQLQILFKNVGIRPAFNVFGKILFVNKNLDRRPFEIIDISIANEIVAPVPFTYRTGTTELSNNVAPSYIVIVLKYYDSLIKKSFNQTIYSKWRGVEQGKIHKELEHISAEEKQKIEEHLKDYLQNFIK